MLFNASYHGLFQKNYSCSSRVHPSLNFKPFRFLHNYWNNLKNSKMLKTKKVSQKRRLVPTVHSEPDFSQTCSFRVVLDNFYLFNYMKFQKMLINEYRVRTKNIKNALKIFVPHLWPPSYFFQESGSVTFVPLWCPNFVQNFRRN